MTKQVETYSLKNTQTETVNNAKIQKLEMANIMCGLLTSAESDALDRELANYINFSDTAK